MKVSVYAEGDGDGADTYQFPPLEAARLFCEEWIDPAEETNVCVEPLDDEARALGGWRRDEDSEAFRMFVVVPRVSWEAREVDSFNPYWTPNGEKAARPFCIVRNAYGICTHKACDHARLEERILGDEQ